MKKAIMSLMLSAVMFLSSVPAMATGEEWAAEGSFGKDVKTTEMSAHMTVAGAKAPDEIVGGESAWKITGANWYYHTMYINVSSNALKATNGRHILVEVDYFDNSDEGWFCIKYNSRDKKEALTKRQKLGTTQKWKTASFVLEAPTLSDDLNGGDFGICTLVDNDYNHKDLYIKGVRVKALDEIKPAIIEIDMPNDGHIYFDNEAVRFTIDVTNRLSTEYDADINFVVQGEDGEVYYEQKEAISLKGNQTHTKEVTLDLDRYGVFMLYAEGVNEELGYRFTGYTKMSYAPYSEYQNDKFGACNHLGWHQAERKPTVVFPLMRKAGMGWTRDEILWRDYEKVKGEYALTSRHKEMMTEAEKNNLKHLIITFAGNALYTETHNTVPLEDYQLEAFGKYVYNVVKDTKGYINDFEYWNEYGSHDTVTAGADRDFYIKLAKVYYDNIKAANPEANAVGFTTAGTGVGIIKHTFDQGTYNHVDDVSYHVYSNGDPMQQNVAGDTKSIRELLDQYPRGKDMGIWLTECGFTTGKDSSFAGYYDRYTAAEYMVKEFAIQVAAGVEKMFIYSMLDEQADPKYAGAAWGLLDYFGTTQRDVPYAAKPAYIAIAAMNSKLGTPEFVEDITLANDSVYAFHYKRQHDGKDTAVLWGENKCQFVTLKLGGAAEFFDIMGNPISVMSDNGEYSLQVTNQPIYVVGDFASFEEGSPKVALSATSIKVPSEDEVEVKLYKSFDTPLMIEAKTEDGSEIELGENPQFIGRIAALRLKVKGTPGHSEPVRVVAKDESGREYFSGDVIIEYDTGLAISGRTKLYQDTNIRRWQMQLDINSRFHIGDLKARLKISEPAAFAGREYDLGTLKTGDNRVLFHLPEIPNFTSYNFKATITLDNGYTQEFETPIDFALAYKAKTPPEIDGVMSEGEWKKEGKLVSNRVDQTDMIIANPPWKGVNDLSCESYLMWDEEYFYLAFKVKDDIFSCNYRSGSLHNGDSVQFGTSYSRDEQTPTFTEISMALTPDGEAVDKNRAETGTSQETSGTVVKVTRDEKTKTTQYEMKMPWSEITPESSTIAENTEIGFSMLVNDNDTFGRRGWIEFGSGIGRNKSATRFARIRLVK